MQLTLHPCVLLEHLQTSYGLRFDGDEVEPRVYDFLKRFQEREWGLDALGLCASDGDNADVQVVAMDALSNAQVGNCVVEWCDRSVEGRTQRISGNAERPSLVKVGLEGLMLRRNGQENLLVVPLRSVIRTRKVATVEPVKPVRRMILSVLC